MDVELWPGNVERKTVVLGGVESPKEYPIWECLLGKERCSQLSECEIEAAVKTTEFTRTWLGKGPVTVLLLRRGKRYGTMQARITRDDEDLEEILLETGHAKPVSGDKPKPWCWGEDDGAWPERERPFQ